MDAVDETSSSSNHSQTHPIAEDDDERQTSSTEIYNEDESSRKSSIDHFDVDPAMIERRMSGENGNKTRPPIIKTYSSSSSDSSSEPSLENEDLSPRDGLNSSIPPVVPSIAGIPPPVQIMQRPEPYEPDRIPSSVFQRSSSDVPITDWSIASNDSLFSINVGNSHSISREQAAVMMIKSGEIPKSPELFSFTRGKNPVESPHSPAAFPASGTSPPVVESGKENGEKRKEATAEEGEKAAKEDAKKAPTVSWRSSSKHSDKSQNSSKSFAFPITEPNTTTVDDKNDKGGEQPITSQGSNNHCWDCSSCFSCCSCLSCCHFNPSFCNLDCISCCSLPSCAKCSSSCSPCKLCGKKKNCECCCSLKYCLRPSCCFCSEPNCSLTCCQCGSCSKKQSRSESAENQPWCSFLCCCPWKRWFCSWSCPSLSWSSCSCLSCSRCCRCCC